MCVGVQPGIAGAEASDLQMFQVLQWMYVK
jgi:hypothetical protein